jgi:hypothetical protein
MGPSRKLFIDESLSKRLAALLKHRGRAALSSSELGFHGLLDAPLLRKVYEGGEDIVFVTADDSLPAEHAEVLGEVGATVATVAPFEKGKWPVGPCSLADEEAWKREIVSRWAHAMQEQPRRTHKRYFLNGGRKWRPRRKPVA